MTTHGAFDHILILLLLLLLVNLEITAGPFPMMHPYIAIYFARSEFLHIAAYQTLLLVFYTTKTNSLHFFPISAKRF